MVVYYFGIKIVYALLSLDCGDFETSDSRVAESDIRIPHNRLDFGRMKFQIMRVARYGNFNA